MFRHFDLLFITLSYNDAVYLTSSLSLEWSWGVVEVRTDCRWSCIGGVCGLTDTPSGLTRAGEGDHQSVSGGRSSFLHHNNLQNSKGNRISLRHLTLNVANINKVKRNLLWHLPVYWLPFTRHWALGVGFCSKDLFIYGPRLGSNRFTCILLFKLLFGFISLQLLGPTSLNVLTGCEGWHVAICSECPQL